MDSIYPWLDATAVRRLADRLMNPDLRSTSTATANGAGPDGGFEGYALSNTAPVPAPEATPPIIAEPPFEEVSSFCDWMREQYSATGLFILDHQGTVIFEESPQGRWHFVAQKAALASGQPNSATSLRLKISATATLEIISVNTDDGGRVAGAVVLTALDPADVTAVQAELQRVTTS
jgi:hypothetical protein